MGETRKMLWDMMLSEKVSLTFLLGGAYANTNNV